MYYTKGVRVTSIATSTYIISFNKLGIQDIDKVGGKNASLGEMICHLIKLGIKVPDGFATTAEAFREFLVTNHLSEKIYPALQGLNVDDLSALKKTSEAIREAILAAPLQPDFIKAICDAYLALCANDPQCAVAVRSSATAEDLPEASFAGQQETYLNVSGIEAILEAIKQVFASLFSDRAIAYRVHHGFSHQHVALSVGIQKMIRSDLASSGVMFTLDTESGFQEVVLITSSYGLGEMVVQGAVNPDEFYVHKPTLAAGRSAILRRNLGSKQFKMICSSMNAVKKVEVSPKQADLFSLNDDEIQLLAYQAVLIEKHYGCPMDIEWGKDGNTGNIYILQARPETVKNRVSTRVMERFHLRERGKVLAQGRSIGQKIGTGTVRIVHDMKEIDKVQAGDVLVADMTDPDWEPVMKRATAIVTNRGGRTCHAAIIARELGIPAVVGTQDATQSLSEGKAVTISCAEGEVGFVYEGTLSFELKRVEIDKMPQLPLKIMMNIANPDRAFDFQFLPNEGIGLARLEFIISQMIGIHPNACLAFDTLSESLKEKIRKKMAGYVTAKDFYIQRLSEGIATLAAAFYPKKVIVRFSDFKSNEYANLLGGAEFEPKEENPMIGFRGASRYVSDSFKPCFALECDAIKYVRNVMGLSNVEVMIPFVRTVKEAKNVIDMMETFGLKRGKEGLRIIMMCEVPTNALLAEQYLEYFDGFSIGSNDLTQLTLGLDRDSGFVASAFDERDLAVKFLMAKAIEACKKQGKYIGICGQGPSDYPDLAKWLVEKGVETVSLNPDTVLETWLFLA